MSYEAELKLTHLPYEAEPGSILDGIRSLNEPSVLDSSAYHPYHGRYTVFACSPIRVIELSGTTLCDGNGQVIAEGAENIWPAIDREFSFATVVGGDSSPFAPGWIGYFGYEMSHLIEQLPGKALRDTVLPDMRLAFYDSLLVFDSATRMWSRIDLVFDEGPNGAGEAADELVSLLQANEGSKWEYEGFDPAIRPVVEANSNFSPDDYKKAVERCVEYIAAGDIFQVNFSQRFEVKPSPPPMDLYQVLRARNPAWYSAWIGFDTPEGPCAVLSSSPELFLRVSGRKIVTCPIKGTRPRIGDHQLDREARTSLIASEKDNAELAMIIDLLRNDLGRVCRFGSVRVSDRRRLETHPTVFHLVGTVEGELRPDVSTGELLRATFPGGSITGAPKIRAMEIIDELEPVARGVYTGCLGLLGADGSMCLNIAIRTIVCDCDRALVQVGGGIVADSDPEAEYRETLDKARALLESIKIASKP